MSPGQDLDGFGEFEIFGDPRWLRRSVRTRSGQHFGVASVRLRPRSHVALVVAAGSQPVDGVDLIAGRDQGATKSPRSVSIPTITCSGSSTGERSSTAVIAVIAVWRNPWRRARTWTWSPRSRTIRQEGSYKG